jgi:hypothetical protein
MLEFVTSGLSVAISSVGCGQPSARASATAKTVSKRQKVAQTPLLDVITRNWACKNSPQDCATSPKDNRGDGFIPRNLAAAPYRSSAAHKNERRVIASPSARPKFALWFLVREALVRRTVILAVLVLSLPNAASAGMLSLYSPFDKTHNGHNGSPSPPASSPPAANEALMGCGRGRYRDQVTHQCRGPGDLR